MAAEYAGWKVRSSAHRWKACEWSATFSDVFLSDRQALLQWQMNAGLKNESGISVDRDADSTLYIDAASGTQFRIDNSVIHGPTPCGVM